MEEGEKKEGGRAPIKMMPPNQNPKYVFPASMLGSEA